MKNHVYFKVVTLSKPNVNKHKVNKTTLYIIKDDYDLQYNIFL